MWKLLIAYIILILLTLPLLLSDELRTPHSPPHNRLGRIPLPFTDKTLAIVDIVPTVISGIVIGLITNTSIFITLPSVFIIGILVHFTFNIQTPLNQLLGL